MKTDSLMGRQIDEDRWRNRIKTKKSRGRDKMKEKRQKEKVIEARKIRKQNIKEKEDQDNNRTK